MTFLILPPLLENLLVIIFVVKDNKCKKDLRRSCKKIELKKALTFYLTK